MAFEQFISTDAVADVYRMEPWEPAWVRDNVCDSLEGYESLDLGVRR